MSEGTLLTMDILQRLSRYDKAQVVTRDPKLARPYAMCMRRAIQDVGDSEADRRISRIESWADLLNLLDETQNKKRWADRSVAWSECHCLYLTGDKWRMVRGLPTQDIEIWIPLFDMYVDRVLVQKLEKGERIMLPEGIKVSQSRREPCAGETLDKEFGAGIAIDPQDDYVAGYKQLLEERRQRNDAACKIGQRVTELPQSLAMPYGEHDHALDAMYAVKHTAPPTLTDEQRAQNTLHTQKENNMAKLNLNNVLAGITSSATTSVQRTASRSVGQAALQSTTSMLFKLLPIKWGWWARITGRKQAIIQHPLTGVAIALAVNAVARETLAPDNKVLKVTQAMQDAALMELLDANVDIKEMVKKLLEPLNDGDAKSALGSVSLKKATL